ncbi:hypothetical protein [Neobacillus sp. D3-1R]|uniref:hypothetical protein n=1 Tax=Neobacillus sp. D3-1R TaxID=3445778 RepID=UPI003FA03B4E
MENNNSIDELKIKNKQPVKNPVKNTIFGCSTLILLVIVGLSLLAFFFVGPPLIKEHFFKTDDAIGFSTQYSVSILVMIFITLWTFACMYWVNGAKRFLLFMIVPFLAFVLLFFNYDMITYKGVETNPYFQVSPSVIKWEDMQEVAFMPSKHVSRRETSFEIKLVYLYKNKSHWIDNINLDELKQLKKQLSQQGDVPVFIYPIEDEDMARLNKLKRENKDYYKEVLEFFEIKNIKKDKREHILVNERFY